MYKDVETKVVTFDCMPWQAPSGGNDCEVCNKDDLPCSEYRCRASALLGIGDLGLGIGAVGEYNLALAELGDVGSGYEYFFEEVDVEGKSFVYGVRDVVSGDVSYFGCEASDEFGEVAEELVEEVRAEKGFGDELFGVVMFFVGDEDVEFGYLIGFYTDMTLVDPER